MNNDEQNILLKRDLDLMRERYLNLVNIHGELQKQNSILEERILSIVETFSNEKNQLEDSLILAKQRIFHLQDTINDLEIEKQRYKNDCNLAVTLLHQNPNEFISSTSEQTNTNQIIHSQQNVIIPTFPPIFATPLPIYNTTTTSMPVVSHTITDINDNLRLAESLFKSNTVHRYPARHFICSKCHQTMKYCDVSIQTSLDNHHITSQQHRGSLTISDNELTGGRSWFSIEPHNHAHRTVKEYQSGNTKSPSQNAGLSSNSIPQMHHV